MKKDIGIGVIGLGMGRNMIKINSRHDSRLEVRAICDTDEVRLKQAASEFGIEHATTDYRELLDRDDIHVIGVYSPDHLHAEQATAALRAGKHCICTKPMVTTIRDCEEIVKLSDETGLKFLVGQTCRFVPRFAATKKLAEDGDLGEIILAEAHYVHDMRPVFNLTPWRYEAPQNFLYGGGCHPIDLLRWFLGDVDEVFVYANCSGLDPRYPPDMEDNFLINLRFKNGKIGRILAIYGIVEPPLPMLSLGVYGKKGTVVDDRVIFDKIEGKPEWKMSFRPEAGHGNEVMRYMLHFEECIIHDKKPLIDARDGAKVIATAAACWESIRTGKPAKVRNEF